MFASSRSSLSASVEPSGLRPGNAVVGGALTLAVALVVSVCLWAGPVGAGSKKEERQARDRAAAEELLARAEGGDVKAQFAGGLMLVQGKVIEKDVPRGLALLERAGDAGDTTAMAALYDCYENGRYGVPKDTDAADRWAEKLGMLSPRQKAKQEAAVRQEIGKMAAEGNLAASSTQALMELQEGSSGDREAALARLEDNARAGDKTACAVLFDMQLKGEYAPGPEVEAAMARHGLSGFGETKQ